MIDNYGLFNEHEDNDNLLILFKEFHFNRIDSDGEVTIYYLDNEVVGYLISNFIRYAKIKYSGIIFLPSKPLIDVVNAVLKNHHLETLSYKKQSGYVIKSDNGKKKVYALNGTFLRDKSISKGRFCSYDDLYIKVDDGKSLIIIDEDIIEGTDFFQMEEK